jgi:hypothetical protein
MDAARGHGTHVAGTLVGKSILGSGNNNPSNINPNQWQGVANGAKIAFFDAGLGSTLSLAVPSLYKIVFPLGYNAGARVYSNSWYIILNLFILITVK